MSKMKFKRFLICAILGNLSLCNVANATNADESPIETQAIVRENSNACINNDAGTTSDVEMQKVSIKQQLIDEVATYMRRVAPKSDKSLPEYMVEQCLERDLDICFMLAQSKVETAFGTAGIGRASSRHSLFGVYRTYANYKKCIDAYISLLKSNYLVNGKTEKDLMKKYVSKGGHRYAGSTNYEVKLSKTYREITSNTVIDNLQIQYTKM